MDKWQFLISVLVLFIMILLVIEPQIYMQSCLNGLLIWRDSVLPALFPFFFFSSILIKLGVLDTIGAKLGKIMQKIFHCPGSSGIIYLLSIVSGYPVGAKITSEMEQAGALTRNQVVRINSFCSTSGPLFIIGSVGVGMFVNYLCGIILLASHILGALANGLLYRNYKYKNEPTNNYSPAKVSAQEILSKTMYDAIISILIVGGYIIIFNIVIDMLFNVGLLQIVSQALGYVFSLIGLPPTTATGLTTGIFEVTRGCLDLSKSGLDIKLVTILASMLISWGGFSIHLQALTFLSKCKISVAFYLLQKFTQSLFSGLICFIILLFVPI